MLRIEAGSEQYAAAQLSRQQVQSFYLATDLQSVPSRGQLLHLPLFGKRGKQGFDENQAAQMGSYQEAAETKTFYPTEPTGEPAA
jgi:hypothetical protein